MAEQTIEAPAIAGPGAARHGRPRVGLRTSTLRADPWPLGTVAAVAMLMVLGIRDYTHSVLSAQSDTVLVALCLGAIDRHLSGRPRIAFVLLVLASLGRPEAWPFTGLYALWLLRVRVRVRVGLGLASVPLLWFGPKRRA